MRYLSLFSGIEAATQAWRPLGWECVGVSEIEPFPCAVLAHHYPDVPNLGDVTKITEDDIKKLGQIDLVVFGSPCQGLSVAGARKGLDDERSNLFYDAIRVIEYAKRHCGTRFALLENVPGAFSSNKGADFTEVVKHMAGLDELNTPKNGWGKEGAAVGSNGLLEWLVLDAQWFGLAQRRKRVFAIVDFGDWTSRPPILLERESLRGDTPPSRETRESITAAVRASTATRCFDKQRIGQYADNNVASTCAARDYKDATDLVVEKAVYSFDSLASNSMKSKNPHSGCRQVELAKCLDTSNGCPSKNQGGLAVVAIAGNIIGRTEGNGGNGIGFDESGACYTLTTNDRHAVAYGFEPGITQREGNPCVRVEPAVAYGLDTKINMTIEKECSSALLASGHKEPSSLLMAYGFKAGQGAKAGGIGYQEEVSPTLTSANSGSNMTPTILTTSGCLNPSQPQSKRVYGVDGVSPALQTGTTSGDITPSIFYPPSVVRRLTPKEAEKLQGFPDNFTKIPYRNKSADDCPNGVRYKALGNSMAVNVMAWIGQKIQQTQGVKAYT